MFRKETVEGDGATGRWGDKETETGGLGTANKSMRWN
jgi:hypothetical protein